MKLEVRPLPSLGYLNDNLYYKDGDLYWKTSRSGATLDKPAGHTNHAGYRMVTLCGYSFMAHRIVWKLFNGEDPESIDHIDGNPYNNSISNLRNVNTSINMRNKLLSKNNKSGFRGVYLDGTSRKWRAQGHVNNKCVYLGSFNTREDAIKARKEFEETQGDYTTRGIVDEPQ